MNNKYISNMCDILLDWECDLISDIQEYGQMEMNGEISPEECKEKQDALNELVDAIQKVFDILTVLEQGEEQ